MACISMRHHGIGDHNHQCSPVFFWLSLQSVQLDHCSVGNAWIHVSLRPNLPGMNYTNESNGGPPSDDISSSGPFVQNQLLNT